MEHHRASTELVQDLRRAGPDARTLSGGQHNCGKRTVGHGLIIALSLGIWMWWWLGGKVSNLLSGLQRPLCCRYTTPDTAATIAAVALGKRRVRRVPGEDSDAFLITCAPAMGSLIKKRRKRMRKKKHKKLLKKTRWQRRQQGK